MNDILEKIVAVKREEVAAGQKKVPLAACDLRIACNLRVA